MAEARMRVKRTLTDTPLARQHDRMLTGRVTRRTVDVPWSRFDRSKYPEPALALACKAQTMLATGEYEAVDLFSRLAAGLALNGAPIDLVAAATRVATDEIRHADYAFRMARLCGGDDVAIEVRTERAETRWGRKLDLETLDLMMIEIPAVGEALACALIAASRERASDPVARALFTSILADEVHHTRLGWYYLAWRAPQWTQAERQRAADRAGEVVMEVERRFWWGRDAPPGSRRAARALGILESTGQRDVIEDVMVREIVPALDRLGLGASYAWRARKRGR
ncbi:MAG TPA: ferritin-like domain-containing protein [Polyangiaceae bacterium]|nr:ferritin-like domain-containing protein [Polyangiaceae bacterium]